MVNIGKLMQELNKLDRGRIQNNYEKRMLESLNDSNLTVRIMKSYECTGLKNFENINQLIKTVLPPSKFNKTVKLIDLESAEFYRHVLVCQNGKPVATGCLNITQAPIQLRENEEAARALSDQSLIEEPFQNFRAVIQYVMLDASVVSMPQ